METTGDLTGYIDVAQVVLYAFWVFFAGLVFYLRREDKREGYPLDSDRTERSGGQVQVVGFPPLPRPKTFLLRDGTTRTAPREEAPSRPARSEPAFPWPGSPIQPTGNALEAGIGPGSWAEREDRPDMTLHDTPKLAPMRVATDYSVSEHDPDPRGMDVIALDGETAGKVTDIWVDRSEMRALFLEVELPAKRRRRTSRAKASGEGEATAGETQSAPAKPETVLLPINFARVQPSPGVVRVVALTAEQFKGVPRLKNPDQVTFLEEDRITGYFGGGHLYAHPARQEPLL